MSCVCVEILFLIQHMPRLPNSDTASISTTWWKKSQPSATRRMIRIDLLAVQYRYSLIRIRNIEVPSM